MNIATLGIAIDPTQAQQGAAVAAQAMQKVAQAAKSATAEAKKVGAEAGQAATTAAKQTEAANQTAFQKMLAAAKQFFGGTTVAAQQSGAATQTMTQQAMQGMAGLKQNTDSATQAIGALMRMAAAAGLALLFTRAIQEGVRFNQTLEDARISIAAVARQAKPDQFRDFNSALKASDEAIGLLMKKAEQSPATFAELVDGFRNTAGAAAQANLSLKQQVDLVVMMSQAFQALGVPMEQFRTEARALMSGNINQDSDAAKMLFGDAKAAREAIEQAKAAGTLYELLSGKMAAFAEAGKAASTSLTVSISNLQDKFQQLAGKATVPIFQAIKEELVALLATLQNPAGQEAWKNLATSVAELIHLFGALLRAVVEMSGPLLTLAKYAGMVWLSMKAVQFTSFIAGLVRSTLAIQGQTTALNTNTMAAQRNNTALGARPGARAGAVAGTMIGTAILGTAFERIGERDSRAAQTREITKELADQIGHAETVNQKLTARAELLKQIAFIEGEIQTAQNSGKWFKGQEIEGMQKVVSLLKDADKNFEKIAGREAARERQVDAVNKRYEAQIESLKRQLDVADSIEKKQAAIKAINDAIFQIPLAKGGTDYARALEVARVNLQDLLKNVDALAGAHLTTTAAAKQYAADVAATNKLLGDQVAMAKAKAEGNVDAVRELEVAKRVEELITSEGAAQIHNKDVLIGKVRELIGYEQDLANQMHSTSIAEKDRAYRLTGLTGQGRVDELKRQLGEVRREQNLNLSRAGVSGLPAEPSSADIQAARGNKADFMSLNQLDNVLLPARDKVRDLELAVQDAEQDMLKASTRSVGRVGRAAVGGARDQVESDMAIMARFQQQIAQMRALVNRGQMSPQEFANRRMGMEDQAAGQLADPKQYESEIGKFRAYQEQKRREDEWTNKRMEANAAGYFKSVEVGIKRQADSWGTMNQQVAAASGAILASMGDHMADAVTAVVTGTKDVGTAFKDMAISILNDIAKIIIKLLIQMAIQAAIRAYMGDTGSVAIGTSTAGNAASGVLSALNGITGVQTYTPAASGGMIMGGSGTKDDVPILAMGGEYVLNRRAVDYYGQDLIQRMNQRQVPRYADGGLVASRMATGRGGKSDAGSGGIQIAINVDAKSSGSGDKKDEKEKGDKLGQKLRAAVLAVIVEEKRAGGLLAGATNR